MMPWWHRSVFQIVLSQFLRLLILSLTRFYFLCATVLLFLSSDVLAAPPVSFENTANLTQGQVPSREDLLYHHIRAEIVGSAAADRQKARQKYHVKEVYNRTTSDRAAVHHAHTYPHHERILRKLNSNLDWHRRRRAELRRFGAVGTPEELDQIEASHKFAAAAHNNAAEAKTMAKYIKHVKAAFSSHGPHIDNPVTEAHHKHNAERQTFKDLYQSATNNTKEHAKSFADHWGLPR